MELKNPHRTSVQMATWPLLDHGKSEEQRRGNSEASEQPSGLAFGENPGAEQAANESAKPVERDQERSGFSLLMPWDLK